MRGSSRLARRETLMQAGGGRGKRGGRGGDVAVAWAAPDLRGLYRPLQNCISVLTGYQSLPLATSWQLAVDQPTQSAATCHTGARSGTAAVRVRF
jgi:hypothetical protein